MRLDKVEISGFKSFCDRQELSFEGGVTGIVGPNGCGKSNISDAISWVLGEQSVKSLRGASMEDVIFAGSQSRQAVGMAEVNLKVSGLNGSSPDGRPECLVTRRLYRNGESEYLMNGQICRLRDIHELFMDTGLGSKAYSIIEQGKIGLILSSKPADRRAIIEEAAGITKYKARRRQTQLKLEAANQNLLRVNDITHEVEKQLESLKRQAGKARRYRALRDEMQGIERILFGLRFLGLEEQSRQLAFRLAEQTDRERAASMVLATEEAQIGARRAALYDEEARLEDARKRLSDITLAFEKHQGRSGYCKAQIAETKARSKQTEDDVSELRTRVGPLEGALATARADEERLRKELLRSEETSREAEEALHAAVRLQGAIEREQEGARDAQVAILGKIATLQNGRDSLCLNQERASSDLQKLGLEVEELEGERSRVQEALDDAQRRNQGALALAARLTREREAAIREAEAAGSRSENHAQEIEKLQTERDSLIGRLSSLQEIVETHSAFDEGARALLSQPEGIKVLGVVADAIETDSPSERAVEAFMGDRLQAVLTPTTNDAEKGIRYLRESGAGRGTFLPLDLLPPRDSGPNLSELARHEPKVKGLLSDRYRVSGPHAAQIRVALPDAIVVESLEEAFEIVGRHGRLSCVTLSGETIRGPLVEGGRGVRGLLAPRREIKELAARQGEVEARLTEAREKAAAAASLSEAAAAKARSLEESIHAAEKELVAVHHDLGTAEEEQRRLERKGVVLATEQAQAEEQRSAAGLRLSGIEEALRLAEGERDQGSRRLTELAGQLAQARDATEVAQAQSSEGKSHLAALRERVAAIGAEARRLAQDHEDLLARIAGAVSRLAEMGEQLRTLSEELLSCERQIGEALAQRELAQCDVALVEDRVREIRNELDSREQALKERRRERETLRDAVSEVEVAQARTNSDLDHLARECHAALGKTAAEAATTLTDEEKGRETETLLAEIQTIRERLDRMGPVNVLAVEQSQELEERHQFLTAQRQDLLDSIAELDSAIKKIDRTSRERFQEAFQIINQHFGEVFRQLFGGGTAGLSLIDEEDILESGIDVMAQPPGKRLQNVMLLSGGEKALTAIALLFAIFQYKPSPFCILDEVDAPLDDANIGRFVKMLEGLKEQTQFVLITHSRKTMEIADQLYGVTMEEPGVSKLVSVRFS